MAQDTTGPEGAAKAIADSKKLMEGWKKGPMGTKSGHLNTAPAESQPSKTDYTHAREARKDGGHEFLGIRSDEGPELNTALKEREDFKAENNKQQ